MLAVVGSTLTEATAGGGGGGGGGAVTVMLAVPLFPSLVAVIVAVPAATPVTRPVADTVATAALELDQVTARPESGLPLTSLAVAVSCTVWLATTLAVVGVTLTVATGTDTAAVVPLATLESAPNAASTLSVPRNATTWNR